MALQTVVATPMWDDADFPTLDQDTGAIRAEVPYRVNSSEIEEVWNATGLPGMGQSYGGMFSNLIVVGRSIRWAHAADIDEDDFGYSIVKIRYSTVSAQPEILVAQAFDAFTSIIKGVSSIQIRADILGNALFEPVAKEIPQTEVVVTAYRPTFPEAAWAAIEGKVNSAAIILPPVFNTSGPLYTAASGSLLARTVEVETAQEDLLKIRYRFGRAVSWVLKQRRTDPDTQQPIGATTDFLIYEPAAFDTGALWGTP